LIFNKLTAVKTSNLRDTTDLLSGINVI